MIIRATKARKAPPPLIRASGLAKWLKMQAIIVFPLEKLILPRLSSPLFRDNLEFQMKKWLLILCFISRLGFCESSIEEFFQTLNNTELEQKKCIVVFSGTPGMGKTTLAEMFETRFGAVRIRGDELRRYYEGPSMNAFFMELLDRMEELSPNGLLVIDRSIDRSYGAMKAFAKEKGYPLFAIRLEVPREQVEERVLKSKVGPENYMKFMNRWYSEYNEAKDFHYDVVFDNSDERGELSMVYLRKIFSRFYGP